MKLKRTRATYVACVLCAVFTPVMLAPVDEPKQPDPSLPQATFSNSANMTSSALANPSASLAATQSFQNNTDNQQPPGNSAPPVIGASSANNSPAEKALPTVAVRKDPVNVDVTVAQGKVEDKSVPPGPQSQLPDPEAGSKKDNADQGQGPPLPSPSPRDSEPEIMAAKKEVVETAPPSVSNLQVPVSGNTMAQGGEGKEASPPQMPSESAMMVGAKPEETKAPQVPNPDISQEAKNVTNESQVSSAGEQAQEPQQSADLAKESQPSADLAKESQPSADLAKESQPSAVPSEIAQSEPVEPLSLSEQSASETQALEPAIEETHKPEGSQIEAQPPKEPEQQAENTQGSETAIEQPKEPEQSANETQEEPEQPAMEEEAKGTDTQDNPIEENVNEDIRDQYENELPPIEKSANDYPYSLDSSQQSSMATDMQANNPSFNDPLGEDTLDNREVTINNGGEFTDDEDSHFFAYFLTIMVSAIIFYLVFHNKQRIIALIIEGRSPGERRGRRTSSRGKYHKLDNNLEEAITATKGANT